jgi:hypothetical protein
MRSLLPLLAVALVLSPVARGADDVDEAASLVRIALPFLQKAGLTDLARSYWVPRRLPARPGSQLHCFSFSPAQDGAMLSVVYSSGLQYGWRSASYGCMDCNFADAVRKRSVSGSSIYASIAPWAAFVLESDTPFLGSRCCAGALGAAALHHCPLPRLTPPALACPAACWICGSRAPPCTMARFLLKTRSTGASPGGYPAVLLKFTSVRPRHDHPQALSLQMLALRRELTLDSAGSGDAKVLFGPDNEGWYHMQVGAAHAVLLHRLAFSSVLVGVCLQLLSVVLR